MSIHVRLILIAVLYLVSLPLPALPGRLVQPEKVFPSGMKIGAVPGEWGAPGWVCLVFIPFVCFYPAWWANPCLLIGGIGLACDSRRWARVAGWIALALAASFPIQAWLFDRDGGATILQLPGDIFRYWTALGPGYWCWLASIAVLVLPERKAPRSSFKPAEPTAIDEV